MDTCVLTEIFLCKLNSFGWVYLINQASKYFILMDRKDNTPDCVSERIWACVCELVDIAPP